MAEYKTEKQVNYGWGLSLNMTGKAPAIAKRIFETFNDAQTYIDDVNDSAIAGLQLSVINDSDSSKNGIYFVKSIGDGINSGVLELIGKDSVSAEGVVDLTGYAKIEDVDIMVTNAIENALDEFVVPLPTFTNGLENTDNNVGIKIDEESEFTSVSESGLKVSGIKQEIQDTFNTYLNTQGFTSRVVYLKESEWESLKEQVDVGSSSWENNVIYMVYSDD